MCVDFVAWWTWSPPRARLTWVSAFFAASSSPSSRCVSWAIKLGCPKKYWIFRNTFAIRYLCISIWILSDFSERSGLPTNTCELGLLNNSEVARFVVLLCIQIVCTYDIEIFLWNLCSFVISQVLHVFSGTSAPEMPSPVESEWAILHISVITRKHSFDLIKFCLFLHTLYNNYYLTTVGWIPLFSPFSSCPPPPPMGYCSAEATGLGFVCFVVINPCVLSANRVDLGFFVSYFPILLPPPPSSEWTWQPPELTTESQLVRALYLLRNTVRVRSGFQSAVVPDWADPSKLVVSIGSGS